MHGQQNVKTEELLCRYCMLYKIAFNLKYIERGDFYVCSCNSEADVLFVSNNHDTKRAVHC